MGASGWIGNPKPSWESEEGLRLQGASSLTGEACILRGCYLWPSGRPVTSTGGEKIKAPQEGPYRFQQRVPSGFQKNRGIEPRLLGGLNPDKMVEGTVTGVVRHFEVTCHHRTMVEGPFL